MTRPTKPHLILLSLCLAFLTVPFALQARAQSPADNNPDLIEVRKYTLSMDKMEKLVAATQALNQYVAAHPAVKQKMDAGSSDNLSLDQKSKYFDANFPEAVAIIQQNGLSSREYIVVSLAFINDFSFVAMKRQGTLRDYPPNSITAENATFVDANFDKLQAMSQKLTPPDPN